MVEIKMVEISIKEETKKILDKILKLKNKECYDGLIQFLIAESILYRTQKKAIAELIENNKRKDKEIKYIG